MELRHLRYFVSVAERSNFTKAAADHFVAQSALSQQINRLEREIGSALFVRSSRAVHLTEAGAVLLPLARRIIADVENARTEMDALAGIKRGKLRLGLMQTQATAFDILGKMGEFHRNYPGVEFEVTDAASIEMASAVASGVLDLAIVGLTDAETPPSLTRLQLALEPMVAVVATTNPLAARDSVSIPELVSAGQFINFRQGSGLRRRVDEAFARAGIAKAGNFELGQITDMIHLAALDVGVTIVPKTTELEKRRFADKRFAIVPLRDPLAQHPVSVVYDPLRISAAARAFLDELDLPSTTVLSRRARGK
jgi:DNA-binding transcriptional LysR family regulator